MRGMEKALLPYVFIAALFLVPLGSAQVCGNSYCEFSSVTISSGSSQTTGGHTVSMNYLGQKVVSISVDASAPSMMLIGDMLSIGNVPVRVVDINDALQQAKIAIGENTMSCNQDCFGTYEMSVPPSVGESYSNPDIDCNPSTRICAVAFEEIFGSHVKSSYLDYSQAKPLPSQQVSFSNENSEPRVAVGNINAFVEWIKKTPASMNSPDKYNIMGSLITANTNSLTPLEISDPNKPFPKSLHGPPVYVPSLRNFVSYWTEALYLGRGSDVIGTYIWEGSTPPRNYISGAGAFYADNSTPPSNSKDPYMVYTGASDQLALVWSEEDATGESDIMMQFYPAAGGGPIQGSLFQFNKTTLQDRPILSKGSNFIVFFEDSILGAAVNILSYVQNQLIAPSKPFSFPLNPSVITLAQFAVTFDFNIRLEDVAYNPTANEYVLVWTQLNPASTSGSRDTILQAVSPSGIALPGKQKLLIGYGDPVIAYTGLQNAPYVIASKKGPGMNSHIALTFFDSNLNPNPKVSVPLIVPPGLQRKYIGSTDTATKALNVTRTTLTSVVIAGLSCQLNPSSCPALSLTKLKDGDNVPIADDVMLTFIDIQNMPRMIIVADFNDTHPDTGDFSSLKIESNENTTAIDHTGLLWEVAKLYIAVPNNNNGAYVLVCPDAKTLSEVQLGCSNAVEFTSVNNTKQSKISASGLNVTAQLDDTNTSYFIGGDPLGLPGTGATTSKAPQAIPVLVVTAESGKGVGEQVRFTASYISGSTCTVWFTAPPTQTKSTMPANASNPALYEYNRTFNDIGTYYDANFECQHASGNAYKTKSFSIGATQSNEPVVILNTPSNNAALQAASVPFKCTAQAVQPNKITSIDLFIDGSFKDTNATLNSLTASASFTQTLTSGQHTYNCRATDNANNRALGSLNFTFTVNTGATLRPCTSNDWTCSWTPSDSSCQPGSTQTYQCSSPQAGSCSNPDPVKPTESTKQCTGATSTCTDSDYENATWSACSSSGIQTGTRRLKDGSTCSGPATRTETKPCSAGDNTLLIILVIVIIAGAAGGAFFYLHRKGTKPPKDEEETLWDEEYGKGGESEEPGESEEEYSDEEYEEDKGK